MNFAKAKIRSPLYTSDVSGMKKVGFGRVREFPKFEKSGSGISGMKKVGFGRELKSRVSGIFGFYIGD